jgi:hypothetical protein
MPVDESVALQAVALRQAAGSRVPAIDSMSVATALEGAILVHRDSHFLSIPEGELRQQFLAAEIE